MVLYIGRRLVSCECGCGEYRDEFDNRGRPRRFKEGHGRKGRHFLNQQKDYTGTRCSKCDSEETKIEKNGRPKWYYNGIIDNISYPTLCRRCYNNFIVGPKWHPINNPKWNAINGTRTLDYRNRAIRFDFDIHCGVCNWCRAVAGIDAARTHRHHDENRYDDSNPLRFTIEICDTCHPRETYRLRKTIKQASSS